MALLALNAGDFIVQLGAVLLEVLGQSEGASAALLATAVRVNVSGSTFWRLMPKSQGDAPLPLLLLATGSWAAFLGLRFAGLVQFGA